MVPTGSSGIAEVLVGSNTEKIVRNASCPVISVPAKASIKQIKRILVPIDIRELKHSFLEQVAYLSRKARCSFRIPLGKKPPHNIENEEQVSEEIGQLIKGHHIADFEFTIVKHVFPSDGILSRAEDSHADIDRNANARQKGYFTLAFR